MASRPRWLWNLRKFNGNSFDELFPIKPPTGCGE
jgi:hypothetical protein